MAYSRKIIGKNINLKKRSRKGGMRPIIMEEKERADLINPRSGLLYPPSLPPNPFKEKQSVVILSKLAGGVPQFADEIHKELGLTKEEVGIYFGWCPFNIKDNEDYELISNYPKNIEFLKNWGNVDHTNKKKSVAMKKWSGVTTDAYNSVAMLEFLETLNDKTWPNIKFPIPVKNESSTKTIPSYFMDKAVSLIMYDSENPDNKLFTNFLLKNINTLNGINIIDSFNKFNETNSHIQDPVQRKNVLKKWCRTNSYEFNRSDRSKDNWAELLENVYNFLDQKGKLGELEPEFKQSLYNGIQSKDASLFYGELFNKLELKGWDDNKISKSGYRWDNFLKVLLKEVPDSVSGMATTDGCIAMAIIAMDLFNIDPITSDFLVHANAYSVYNLKEWSALKIKKFLDKKKIKKSDKPLHIITDMEADDLTAFRIFANFYNDITIYITLHESTDTTFFDTAKNFLLEGLDESSKIKIYHRGIVCHPISPNYSAIAEHYSYLLNEIPNQTLSSNFTAIISNVKGGGSKRKSKKIKFKRRKTHKGKKAKRRDTKRRR